MSTAPILSIDIETSGLPGKDRYGNSDYFAVSVLSFGWEDGCLGVIHDGGEFFIRHDPMPVIEPSAAAVNKITPQMLQGGIPSGEAAERVNTLFSSHCIICGHNLIDFDLPIIHASLGVDLWSGAQIIDTKLIWKAYSLGMCCPHGMRWDVFYGRVLARPEKVVTSLEQLCGLFAIDYGRAHSASYDASITMEVLRRFHDAKIIHRVLQFDLA